PGQGARFGEFASQVDPGISGIMARKQLAVMGASEDPIRVGAMGGKRPNRRIRLDRQRQRPAALPAIVGALDRTRTADGSITGGDEQRLWVVSLQRQAAAVR